MQFEQLINTSAPHGLDEESGGYVTVARTENLPQEMIRRLKEASSMETSLLDQGILLQRLLVFNVNKIPWVVLSQISSSGLDYTGRPNRIAHHLASPLNMAEEGDPVRIFSTFKFITKWEGNPRLLGPQEIKIPPKKPRMASTWKSLLGDAGSAGTVARLAFPGKRPLWIESKNLSSLELVSEISSLLPSVASWKLSFSLYASEEDQLSWSRCTLRFVPKGREKLIPPGSRVINPSTITIADGDSYVDSSRKGIPFDQLNVKNVATKKYSEHLENEKKLNLESKAFNKEKKQFIDDSKHEERDKNFIEKQNFKNYRITTVLISVLIICFSVLIGYFFIEKNKYLSLLEAERVVSKSVNESLDKIQERLNGYSSVGTLDEVKRYKFDSMSLAAKLTLEHERIELMDLEIESLKSKVEFFKEEQVRLQEKIDSRGAPKFLELNSLAEIFVGNDFTRVSYTDLESGLSIEDAKVVKWHLAANAAGWEKEVSGNSGMLTFKNKNNGSQVNLDCVNLNNRFYLKIASGKDLWPSYNFKLQDAFFLVMQFGDKFFLVEGKQDGPAKIKKEESIQALFEDPSVHVALSLNSFGSIKKSNPSGVVFLDSEGDEYTLSLEEEKEGGDLVWKGSTRPGINDFALILNTTINNMINSKDQNIRLISSQLDYLRNYSFYDQFDDLVKDPDFNNKNSLFPTVSFLIKGIPDTLSAVEDWNIYRVPIIWGNSFSSRFNK